MTTPQAKDLKYYQNDPCAFVREILGVSTNFATQDAILRSVRDNPRTVVRAGNGSGKTVTAAESVLYAACCLRNCLVVTTASTNRQVELQLWAEIRRLHSNARRPLGGELLATELRFPKTRSKAIGFSTDDPGLFEGWHAPRMLVVIDEAKSVPQAIFDAAERLLTSGGWVRLLVISSPGSPVGPFYDCFNRNGDIYKQFHIKCGESPFVRAGWVEERRIKWGAKSPLFLSAAEGEFSVDADGAIVIPLTYVMQLIEEPPQWTPGMRVGGIDLAAGGGDESAFSIFDGNKQIALIRWNERDTMVTAGKIISICERYKLEPGHVNIDEGGLGKPICDRLDELGWRFNRFNWGGRAMDNDHFQDAGAELWTEASRLIQNKQVILLEATETESQLTQDDLKCQLSGRRVKPRSDGRVQLESKEEMRKRLLPSPDLADATILSMVGRRSVDLVFCNSDGGLENKGDGVGEKTLEDIQREHYQKHGATSL